MWFWRDDSEYITTAGTVIVNNVDNSKVMIIVIENVNYKNSNDHLCNNNDDNIYVVLMVITITLIGLTMIAGNYKKHNSKRYDDNYPQQI